MKSSLNFNFIFQLSLANITCLFYKNTVLWKEFYWNKMKRFHAKKLNLFNILDKKALFTKFIRFFLFWIIKFSLNSVHYKYARENGNKGNVRTIIKCYQFCECFNAFYARKFLHFMHLRNRFSRNLNILTIENFSWNQWFSERISKIAFKNADDITHEMGALIKYIW